MKKILILIILNLLSLNNFCMKIPIGLSKSEMSDLESSDAESDDESFENHNNNNTSQNLPKRLRLIIDQNQESFEAFFTEPKLKKQANLIFANSEYKNNIGFLFIIPIDILKKIIFDYLINIKSTDEQEIYKNFKNLAKTCKYFSLLGKVIISQIAILSEKQINSEYKENLTHIHNEIHEFRSVLSNKNITTSKAPQAFVSIAAKQNKALSLSLLYDKITRKDPLLRKNTATRSEGFIVMSGEDYKERKENLKPRDQVEHALILAAENNSLAAAKVILRWVRENKEPVDRDAIKRLRMIYNGNTPLHIAIKEHCDLSLVELLSEDNLYLNVKNFEGNTPLNTAAISYLSLQSYEIDPKYELSVIKLLIEHGAKNLSNDKGITPKMFLQKAYQRFHDEKTKILIDKMDSSCQVM